MNRQFPIEFSVTPGSCILGALMLLLLPLRLVFAALLAALIHEGAHILALKLCKNPVSGLQIGVGQILIRTAPLPPGQELLCALAGPFGSFLCLLLVRSFPLLALCGFIQGAYNLLPLYPLDGGRALNCILQLFIPRYTRTVTAAVAFGTTVLIEGSCIYLFFHTGDALFLLVAMYFLTVTSLRRKTPCKDGRHWVQYT